MFTVGEKTVYEELLNTPNAVVFKEANGIVFLDKNTANLYCKTNPYSRNFAVFLVEPTSDYYMQNGNLFLKSRTRIHCAL